MKFTLLYITLCFFILIPSCKTRDKPEQGDIPQSSSSSPFAVINKDTLLIEISDTPEKRKLGLMFRDGLAWDKGMLFIFENEKPLAFWMKNTRIPLSVAFINSKRTIVDIQNMQVMTEDEHKSRFPALYALEVNKGWFKQHNIRIGDKISFHYP